MIFGDYAKLHGINISQLEPFFSRAYSVWAEYLQIYTSVTVAPGPKSLHVLMAKLLISFYKVSNENGLLGHIMLLCCYFFFQAVFCSLPFHNLPELLLKKDFFFFPLFFFNFSPPISKVQIPVHGIKTVSNIEHCFRLKMHIT